MGMEALNNAARAAGFAMATSDELLEDAKREARTDAERWRPGEVVVANPTPQASSNTLHSVADWMKGRVFSVFGRGAPA